MASSQPVGVAALTRPGVGLACLFAVAIVLRSLPLQAQVPLEVLHTFKGEAPAAPVAGLVAGPDGNLYGTTSGGGAASKGTVFKITAAGAVTVLHSFSGGWVFSPGGTAPLAALVRAADGNFYGITPSGTDGRDVATMFRLTPSGVFTPTYSFGTSWSYASLIQATDGAFDLTFAGPSQPGDAIMMGGVVRVPTVNTPSYLHFFQNPIRPPVAGGADGANPLGALLEGADGNFYGTTQLGGDFGFGTIFRMAPDGAITIVKAFAGAADGASPAAALIQATDGNFYGTTSQGGACDCGTVFRMTPAGDVTVLHAFTRTDGASPVAALTQGSDGVLYGTTSQGGASNGGTVFRLTTAGALTTLHEFDGPADGRDPRAPLLEMPDGTFWGTTRAGGSDDLGTVFTVTAAGQETVVHAFTTDGATPLAGFVRARDGDAYGTTSAGGAFGFGTVVRMTATGAVSVLHSFNSDPEGSASEAALIQGTDGILYGTTPSGGTPQNTAGTIFRTTSAGALTVLHTFTCLPNPGPFNPTCVDGRMPRTSLLQANDGNFYGTTYFGGDFGLGTIFRMTPDGAVARLYAFTGGMDGGSPMGALTQTIDGQLYGTTYYGAQGGGTVFRLGLDGRVTTLHIFAFGSDGAFPSGGLVEGPDGALYGTTYFGGASGRGTIFRVTRDGAVTILHHFAAGSIDGAGPEGLILGRDGNFYGVTSSGGAFELGTIFRVTPSGDTTILHIFTGGPADGARPVGALMQMADGRLVGMTAAGGPEDLGVVFRLDASSVPIAPTVVSIARSGQTGVKVTWSAVLGAVSYTVKRRMTSGAESVVAAGVGTSVTDSATTRGQRYYYVVTALNAFGESLASYEVSITAGRAAPGDFDGDGQTDVAVYRPATGAWYALQSSTDSTTYASYPWGATGDVPVPGDYDGDGVTDAAVYRSSTGEWWVLRSSTHGTTSDWYQWGMPGDVPVVGDFDGDGRTDLAVYRPATGLWFVRFSTSNYDTLQWYRWGGLPDDVPVAADLDGDGKTDLVIYRPSTGQWWVRFSSTNYSDDTWQVYQWGLPGDVPLAGDFDGDGKADLVVYRPSNGTWWMRFSSNGYSYTTWASYQWGLPTDIPLSTDLDGDGRTDLTVYRPSTGEWFTLLSTSNYSVDHSTWHQWGQPSDTPLPGP